MAYGKYFFGTPVRTPEEKQIKGLPFWHEFLTKTFIAKSYREVCDRARQEWRTNVKLRKEVRDYYKTYSPNTKFISVGVGFGGKEPNVSRNRISINIWED